METLSECNLMDAETDILTPAEIWELLRITRSKFYYLAARGRLEFLFKVGNEWRARRRDLDQWITDQARVPDPVQRGDKPMAKQTEFDPVTIDELQALISEAGLEADQESANLLRIRDLETGVILRAVLEENIVFFTVSCMVVAESKLEPRILRRMLDSDNGIATSRFQIHPQRAGQVAISLSNFCKLQELGRDDRDDILSCLQFLVLDVMTARQILAELID